jgi:hypothetical protein
MAREREEWKRGRDDGYFLVRDEVFKSTTFFSERTFETSLDFVAR